ncbi:MAG: hypothetical protein OQL06_15735 [Gammaproteobacteria bacterium]|nr:hypothetical protein [Gammaproteobacteria bacterium]
MLNFFNQKPPLDSETTDWLFAAYNWAFDNFGSDVFFKQTQLILPTNTFFPGQTDNAYDMAHIIFENVVRHSQLENIPWKLVAQGPEARQGISPLLGTDEKSEHTTAIITYDPIQSRDPESLIASFAHKLAHYLYAQANQAPPGNEDHIPLAIELMTVFMGFGIMMTNTAQLSRSLSCASCQGPSTQRLSFLTQHETTYSLAIFCVLKNIPDKLVLQHLKNPLKSYYKKCVNHVNMHKDAIKTSCA